jgi:hypothetical protein
MLEMQAQVKLRSVFSLDPSRPLMISNIRALHALFHRVLVPETKTRGGQSAQNLGAGPQGLVYTNEERSLLLESTPAVGVSVQLPFHRHDHQSTFVALRVASLRAVGLRCLQRQQLTTLMQSDPLAHSRAKRELRQHLFQC